MGMSVAIMAFGLQSANDVHRRNGRAVIFFAEHVANKSDDHSFPFVSIACRSRWRYADKDEASFALKSSRNSALIFASIAS